MPNQMTIRCSACGTPFAVNVRSYVDVDQQPQAKSVLLSGRLNNFACPNCQTINAVATPLLYHDPGSELLIAHVPMELNLNKDQQEKVIGDMLNQMPKDNFKGYMFNPRRAMTLQGLIDQVLEADGITPEMMQEQRRRIQLAQQLIEAKSQDEFEVLIRERDAEIDGQLFQAMTAMAQRMLESGRQDVAQAILMRQSMVAQLSSYGQELLQRQEAQEQIVEEVAQDIEALGDQPQREDFLELSIRYADNEEHLQALVGLARPAFDYQFFEEMTVRIGQSPAQERDSLQALRQKILGFTTAIDQQQQHALRNAAGFLQAALQHENPEEFLRENMAMIDDTFMAVLSANIQHAEQQKDTQTSARLRQLYELVVSILREHMQPELVFVNELLAVEDEAEASVMVAEQAREYGDDLLEVMDAVEQVLKSQGDDEMVQRLQSLRIEAAQALQAYD